MANHRAVVVVSFLMSACGLNTFGFPGDAASNATSEAPSTTTVTMATSEEPPTTITTATSEEPPSTTTSSTATSEEPPTTAADNCELAPECEAGAVETGAQCDSCGVQRRTCQADCTWSPLTCQEDLNTCAYWWLPAGAKVWKRVAVDPKDPFAPKETVLATVDLELQKQIYVLTANTYHILSTVDGSWVGAGVGDTLFGEFEGPSLRFGTAYTEGSTTYVIFNAGSEVFTYTYDNTNKVFAYFAAGGYGPEWAAPDAPDYMTLRDRWSQSGDTDEWIPGDPQALCAEPGPYTYSVSIGDGFVYAQDRGKCYGFLPKIPYAQFKPFTYPGAPANDLIGGASLLDGLWIFRGE